MSSGLAEILAVFVVVVGCGTIVGAAALVSVPLAVLVAGLFLVLFGLVGVWLAAQLSKPAKPPARPGTA